MALPLNVFKTVTFVAPSTPVGIYTAPVGYSGVVLLSQTTNVDSTTHTVSLDHVRGATRTEVVNNNCNYCDYRVDCWKDANDGRGLRTFKYANGYKYFTKIVNEPKVEEILA